MRKENIMTAYETMSRDGLQAVITVQEHTIQSGRAELEHLRAECAALRLQCSTLTGAGASVLNAIHRAGGYHVYDPCHQPRMQRAIQALSDAVVGTLEQRNMKVMPLVDHNDLVEDAA